MKTIKQIADEIGVSKQAIQQKMKKEPLATSLEGLVTRIDGVIHIDVGGEILIKSAFNKKEPTSATRETPPSIADLPPSVDSMTAEYINSLKEQISALQAQLNEEKDKLEKEREHNRQQAERFAEISDKLAELTRNGQILLKQEQDKTVPLLPESTADKKRRLFWQFWKK